MLDNNAILAAVMQVVVLLYKTTQFNHDAEDARGEMDNVTG